MVKKDDWRLAGKEDIWKDEVFKRSMYKQPSDEWTHDHCEFCWVTISEHGSYLHEGYCTLDDFHWICETCFDDFKEMLNWTVVNEINDE